MSMCNYYLSMTIVTLFHLLFVLFITVVKGLKLFALFSP